uniref:Uncharacterized protein n=1 Tax=Glossina pallidipes TaxID=7398 RepID=A0A1A9ZQR8_GLOPL
MILLDLLITSLLSLLGKFWKETDLIETTQENTFLLSAENLIVLKFRKAMSTFHIIDSTLEIKLNCTQHTKLHDFQFNICVAQLLI